MSRLERIVAACGGVLLDNGARALIPGPNHGPHDRSVSLVESEDGRVLIYCFSPKDDWRAVRRALAEKGLLDASSPESEPSVRWTRPRIVAQPGLEERVVRAKRLWNESQVLRGSPASAYLRARAIADSATSMEALRFHPRMTSLDDRERRPALVAAICDAAGEVQGIQATLLTRHGAGKAATPTPRRVIGKLMGGAVRLGAPQDELAIGEGVETMLSASEALGLPAWAALTADNLARFEPPPGVKRLVVASDNDAAGFAAFGQLRERLSASLVVEDAPAPDGAEDWNAWALSRALG